MHSQVESLLDTPEDQASEGSAALPPDDQQNHPDKTKLSSESNSAEHHPDTLNQSRPEGGPGTPSAAKTEERREVMEQFEPGVYVTLLLLPNGTKFFKRIRFRYVVSLDFVSLFGNVNQMRIALFRKRKVSYVMWLFKGLFVFWLKKKK